MDEKSALFVATGEHKVSFEPVHDSLIWAIAWQNLQ